MYLLYFIARIFTFLILLSLYYFTFTLLLTRQEQQIIISIYGVGIYIFQKCYLLYCVTFTLLLSFEISEYSVYGIFSSNSIQYIQLNTIMICQIQFNSPLFVVFTQYIPIELNVD